MKLSKETAEKIVQLIYQQTGFHSIFCDDTGTIIADSANTRNGIVHEGAKAILASNLDFLAITREEAEASRGKTKEGYNQAVRVNGKIIGTYGIAGNPEISKPVAKIAAALVVNMLRDEEWKTLLNSQAQTLAASIHEAAAFIEEINATSQNLVSDSQILAEEAREAAQQVEKTNHILAFIRHVSAQSKLLGLNAAIEAARAGQHGRGFAVVAGEIRNLADESYRSAAEINSLLEYFQDTIQRLGRGIEQSASANQEQAKATGEIAQVLENLTQVAHKLTELANQL